MCLLSCGGNRLDVDISGNKVNVDPKMFHETLSEIPAKDTLSIDELRAEYPSFIDDYLEDMLRIGPADSAQSLAILKQFAAFQDTQEGLDAIAVAHQNNLPKYEEELEKAFAYHQYHFPSDTIPEIVFMHSGFNYSVYPYNNEYVANGLDYFLGESEVMQKLDPSIFPQYMRDKMRPEYTVTSAVRGWLLVKNQEHYSQKDLLSTIMYWGKIMYLMDACFPETEDYLKMDYSPSDIVWCEENERSIWIELSNQKYLYESRRREVDKWITEGPFTSAADIPQDSPARLGVWMGWQIVRDYMNNNPEVTLEQLLEETNYIKLLNTYKPG